MQATLLSYHNALKDIISSAGGGGNNSYNEHTFRTAFENLLNALKPHSDIRIIHEAKGQGNIRPDFKVIRKSQGYESLLGFIECKNYEVNFGYPQNETKSLSLSLCCKDIQPNQLDIKIINKQTHKNIFYEFMSLKILP